MANMWEEVVEAKRANKRELTLTGQSVSNKIDKDGLQVSVFELTHLNFLEISNTCLDVLADNIGQLVNLNQLSLRNNKLHTVSSHIGKLSKLKFLDLSGNQLEAIPDVLHKVTALQSLNISLNKLSSLPNLCGLFHLIYLNFANNNCSSFPESILDEKFTQLSEIRGNNNKISSIPGNIKKLLALKILDLNDNALVSVPGELGDCPKLKDIFLKGNKLTDKRLQKLVEQCRSKQILDYVRSHCPKMVLVDNKNAGKGKLSKKGNKGVESSKTDEIVDKVKILHAGDTTLSVVVTAAVRDVRPYITACIVHQVNFQDGEKLEKFIAMQTRLHDTICEKRNLGTIATHDLNKINGKITYDARPPANIKLFPLGKNIELTAEELCAQLNKEAETLRKEKKKNVYSGIHKYLYLLKDKSHYPCLVDESSQVISFPPITNSSGTKVTEETKDIFVEVTGCSLSTCKEIMDALLLNMLQLGIGETGSQDTSNNSDTENDKSSKKGRQLIVEQVKVVDEEGKLRVVYPSRTDLQLDEITVLRE
ncbi:leucine-rich repeat-containing protein 47-like [Tachypleus tridentatus]|uniref:leucine-rich repeat-containing protein 47-like n=1 Tax=Tachypleus tridentatus TaxID=6853 RepID=UPI003FD0AC40